MWPDQVSNSGPLAPESDALPTALCGLASSDKLTFVVACVLSSRYCFLSLNALFWRRPLQND